MDPLQININREVIDLTTSPPPTTPWPLRKANGDAIGPTCERKKEELPPVPYSNEAIASRTPLLSLPTNMPLLQRTILEHFPGLPKRDTVLADGTMFGKPVEEMYVRLQDLAEISTTLLRILLAKSLIFRE